MAGRRPLTHHEERKLLRTVRKLSPRDRALITAQWFTGFRISEILSLTVSSVSRDGRLLPKISVRPAHLKGGHGTTRWVPILPELSRALERLLSWLGRHYGPATQFLWLLRPLDLSRIPGTGKPAKRLEAH